MSQSDKITINGYEIEVWDTDITSDEIAFASFSGYMAFSGTITEKSLEYLGVGATKLLGQRISGIFSIADGVVTGVFDYNMNKDENLSQIFAERGIELLTAEVGMRAGVKVGQMLHLPIPARIILAVAGAVFGSVVGGVNSDDWGSILDSIANDMGDDLFGAKVITKYDKEKDKLIFSTNSPAKLALEKVWDGYGMMGYCVEHNTPFEFYITRADQKSFSFSFENNTFNFEHCYESSFEYGGINYETFKTLLSRLSTDDFSIQTTDIKGDAGRVMLNFVSEKYPTDILKNKVLSRQKEFVYAAVNLKTFLLKDDFDISLEDKAA